MANSAKIVYFSIRCIVLNVYTLVSKYQTFWVNIKLTTQNFITIFLTVSRQENRFYRYSVDTPVVKRKLTPTKRPSIFSFNPANGVSPPPICNLK